MVFIVRLRHAADVGEGVTLVTQATGDQLGRGGHQLAREHLAFLNQQQGLDLVLRDFQVAAQLDVTNGVLLAFVDVDGDVDVFLVWSNGHLGRSDIHVDIATVQVVGAQTLQVTGQFFTGVLVIVLEERQPVGSLQFKQVDQVFVREDRVTHHVDVLDSRNGAFVDVDLQADAVTRLRHHFGVDGGGVATLGDILALQFVTYTFEGGTLEDLAFGQTGLFESLHQVFSRDRLVTFDLDTGD